jgi:hypothetical protein
MQYPRFAPLAASLRRRLFPICTMLAIGFAAASATSRAQAQDFTVTAPSMSAYVINGQSNPTLNLVRGHTYTFSVSTAGHPFYIKTVQVTGTGSTYDTGVTNNGTTSGTLTFSVPNNAPATLFYQCSVHSVMTNSIAITGSVPAPALPPWAWLALLLSLLAAGVLALRKPRPQALRLPPA